MINWKNIRKISLFMFVNTVILLFIYLVVIGYEDIFTQNKHEFYTVKTFPFFSQLTCLCFYIFFSLILFALIFTFIAFLNSQKRTNLDKESLLVSIFIIIYVIISVI
jgi:hypothetical protein